MTGCSSTGCCKRVASPSRLMLPPERFRRRRSASICNNLRSNSLRALEKLELCAGFLNPSATIPRRMSRSASPRMRIYHRPTKKPPAPALPFRQSHHRPQPTARPLRLPLSHRMLYAGAQTHLRLLYLTHPMERIFYRPPRPQGRAQESDLSSPQSRLRTRL